MRTGVPASHIQHYSRQKQYIPNKNEYMKSLRQIYLNLYIAVTLYGKRKKKSFVSFCVDEIRL